MVSTVFLKLYFNCRTFQAWNLESEWYTMMHTKQNEIQTMGKSVSVYRIKYKYIDYTRTVANCWWKPLKVRPTRLCMGHIE